ncbi:hypothetical protein ACFQU2_22985 [Siccirubricoccus deserti]
MKVTTTKANGLNKFCRKIVALGMSGPAQVRGKEGDLRFALSSIEEMARWNLYESDSRGFYWKLYSPFPLSGAIRMATVEGIKAVVEDDLEKHPSDTSGLPVALSVGEPGHGRREAQCLSVLPTP